MKANRTLFPRNERMEAAIRIRPAAANPQTAYGLQSDESPMPDEKHIVTAIMGLSD